MKNLRLNWAVGCVIGASICFSINWFEGGYGLVGGAIVNLILAFKD